MLPQFPEFKKLEFSDRPDIEAVTSKYPPYSDFNFQSMWSWAHNGSATVSLHNGNLVLSTEGYLSGKPVTTFLGDNDPTATCEAIFDQLQAPGYEGCTICLVPEVSAEGVDNAKFNVDHDDDNSDYIYDLNELAAMPGGKYEDKRRKARMLLAKYPDAVAEEMDLSSETTKDLLLEVNNAWSDGKFADQGYRHLPKEEAALHKFLESDFKDSMCVGIFSKGHLLGYSVFSILSNGYSICHFTKGRVDAPGVYEHLMTKSAAMLVQKGCSLLNYQEDLGLPGLRFFKKSFRPSDRLVKYTITPKGAK